MIFLQTNSLFEIDVSPVYAAIVYYCEIFVYSLDKWTSNSSLACFCKGPCLGPALALALALKQAREPIFRES